MRVEWLNRRFQRYALAVALTALASLLRHLLIGLVGDLPTYITFYPAVMIVALFAGLGPGLLATLLAAAAASWWWVGARGFAIETINDGVSIGLFLAMGTFMSTVAHLYRQARRRVTEREKELAVLEEQARLAAETHRQKELLAVTLASIGDAVIVTDTDGRVNFLNGEAERLTGWSNADAQGQLLPAVFKIVNEQSRQAVENPVDKVLRLGSVVGLANHTVLIAKDGREIPIDDSGAPIRQSDGRVQGVVLVFRDFSEQKEAERILRESESRYRTLFESMDEGFALCELLRDEAGKAVDFRYLEVNGAFSRMTGLPVERTVGRTVKEVISGIEPFWIDTYARIVDSGRGERLDNAVAALGKQYEVYAWPSGNGRFAVVFNDITERKRAEEEREVAIQFLRLVNQAQGTADLVQAATAFFQQQSGCEAVGIRLREGEDFPYYGARGFPPQFVKLENSLCSRNAAGELVRDSAGEACLDCMCGNVICGRFDPSKPFFTGHGSFWTNCTTELLASTTEEDRQARTRNRCNGEGYESVALLPLRIGKDRLGLLQLNDRSKGKFSPEAITLWERLAGSLAVALARSRAEETLKESEAKYRNLNRTLKALSDSNQVMMRCRTEAEYLNEVCRIIVEDCGYAMVWAGYAEDDENKTVRPVAEAGFEGGYLQTLKVTWADTERGRGPTGTAIRTGKVTMCRNMLTDPLFAPWREQAIRRGYASSIVLPLMARDRAFGALTIYSREPDPFTSDDVALLTELSSDLALGITSIRSAEALRQSEERYRSLFNSMTEGFAIHELIVGADGQPTDYRFIDINPAFERLTGLKREDVVGRTHSQVLPGDDPKWLQMYGAVALTGIPVHFDNFAPSLQRHYEVFAYRPAPQQFAVIFMDITERKQMEKALQQAKGAAESASKAKDQFLAVLSHELRTPLTPVLATVSMLQTDHRFDADTRENLEIVRRNVELEARLIDDLLDVTRIERGKVELDKRNIDLCTVLRRAVEVCMPDIEARKLEFGVDSPGGPYVVEADAARLQQVFWNLLKNAIKFTHPGGCVGIRCRREPTVGAPLSVAAGDHQPTTDNGQQTTDYVVVEVNDSGEGIAAEMLPRLFSAFEQGDRRITRQFGGLGLGLAISKAMVEMHGGTIEARSEGVGKGATFTVKLPVISCPLPEEMAGGQPSLATDDQQRAAHPLRILLVEDHGDTARIMRQLLEAHGHQVKTAADVATALQVADEHTFDLLLSDLGLPDGSGLDLMRALRARGFTRPAIALSGYAQEQDIAESHRAGFTEHLTKPVSMPQLQETITAVVGAS